MTRVVSTKAKSRKKCVHMPIFDLKATLFPGMVGFTYFGKWYCYFCGKKMKATWKIA